MYLVSLSVWFYFVCLCGTEEKKTDDPPADPRAALLKMLAAKAPGAPPPGTPSNFTLTLSPSLPP